MSDAKLSSWRDETRVGDGRFRLTLKAGRGDPFLELAVHERFLVLEALDIVDIGKVNLPAEVVRDLLDAVAAAAEGIQESLAVAQAEEAAVT